MRVAVQPLEDAPEAVRPPVSLLADARGLHQSGIGRYLRAILQHLFSDPRFARITLLGDPTDIDDFAAPQVASGRVRVIPFAHDYYSVAAQTHWWRLRASGRLRVDVSFFPHYDVPFAPGRGRRVVMVQDLIHFQMSHLFPAWKRAVAGRVLHHAVHGAARVLVSSQSSRRDLLSRHPGVAPKLSVIPLGVHRDFARGPIADPAGTVPFDGGRPYLLCVGNRKPHKNLAAAVEALSILRTAGCDLRLVVVGKQYEGGGVALRAAQLGVADAVTEADMVSDAELRGLYAGAVCLLFPSLYEGFGLPVLEAMAMGTPVVASERTSVPEVVRDAGLLVDPESPEAMAAAVRRVLDDGTLRSILAERGRRRAAELDWERTASATAQVLYEAGYAPGGAV
jgi:glycosyltransferase involved in cell wall biosynthesis